MANDLNHCSFIGRLGKDPESRYLPSGDAVTSFSIACGWKSKEKEGVEWVNVTTFGKLAEFCGEYLKKGGQVFVSGRLKNETWEGRDGQKHYSTKIMADKVQMLGSKPANTGGSEQPAQPRREPAKRPGGGTGSFDDMDDDIPFMQPFHGGLWRAV